MLIVLYYVMFNEHVGHGLIAVISTYTVML